ncbi:stage V sporulation protein D [Mycobacteroides abscessus subsp. abscessus]|nr:stage V sporulation protein D [Mycobacteroides abscessus subsp. abscessus]
MGDSLRAMGVEPRKEQLEKELTWLDTPMVEVPDLVGITKKELGELIVNLKIDGSGEGETVVRQTPQPGVKLKEGSTIRLYFDDE